jgi:heme/copper-type cytochrome/quinol oxidase subunit 3
MEIPYTVTARPDTGLWNAKLGIWLFLASEVMLFGGLFSSYVFLRLGADFPWPWHELIILPGLINTFVLILSSVTVVFAWAGLKMRNWKMFQVNMWITLLCAAGFMVIKSYEYNGKFNHYSVKLKDGSIIDGHDPSHAHAAHAAEGHDAHGALAAHGAAHTARFDAIIFEDVKAITLSMRNSEGEHSDSDFLHDIVVPEGGVDFKDPAGNSVKLDSSYIKEQVAAYKRAFTAANGAAVPTTLRLTASHPLTINASRSNARRGWTSTELSFKDGTKIEGKLKSDKIRLLVTGWDARQVKGLKTDPSKAHNALLWSYLPEEKAKCLSQADESMATFKAHFGSARHSDGKPIQPHERAEFLREGYTSRKSNPSFVLEKEPVIEIKEEDVKFYTNYTPRLNPYYSIYFMMTGLHGLHVIGGALVLAYFLFFGRKMYDKDPEHLANRVEVGGLFWHFVDLVWIFLFPVFYLL